jgi:hypothetical protein
MVRDFLILSILKKEETPEFQQWSGSTKSPEALRNLIDGFNAFNKRDFPRARELAHSVIEIDSNNGLAIMMLTNAYGNQGLFSDAKKWTHTSTKKGIKCPVPIRFIQNGYMPFVLVLHLKN